MLEKEIEKKFKKEVEKRGAMVLKFVSPGKSGVPDRIVLMKGGRTAFVECKAPGKGLRGLQKHVIGQIRNLGYDVWVVASELDTELFCIRYFGR